MDADHVIDPRDERVEDLGVEAHAALLLHDGEALLARERRLRLPTAQAVVRPA
jgi:hypothetical protein